MTAQFSPTPARRRGASPTPVIAALLLVLCSLGLAACATLGPMILGGGESGRWVELRPGRELIVRLPSLESGASSWELTNGAEPLLVRTSGPELDNPPIDPSALPGRTPAPVEVWRFRATKASGTTTLRFDAPGPEAATSPATRVVAFRVVVRE